MKDRTAIGLMAAGVLAAGVLLPTVAQANVGVTCVDQNTIQINLTNYKAGRPFSVDYTVTTPSGTKEGNAQFTGPSYSFPVEASGGGSVVTRAYGQRFSAAFEACPAPPPPPTTTTTNPAPPPPPASTTPTNPKPNPRNRPATDCATLKSVKAGRKWLVKFGCVTKPRTDCDYLLDHGAGAKWLKKFGCVVILPPPDRPMPRIPVLG